MAAVHTVAQQRSTRLADAVDGQAAACKGRTPLFFAPKAERPQARARRESTSTSPVHGVRGAGRTAARFAREHHEYGFWAGESEEDRHLHARSDCLGMRIRPFIKRDRAPRPRARALSTSPSDCEYDNVPMGKVIGRDAVRDTLATVPRRVRARCSGSSLTRSTSGNLDARRRHERAPRSVRRGRPVAGAAGGRAVPRPPRTDRAVARLLRQGHRSSARWRRSADPQRCLSHPCLR